MLLDYIYIYIYVYTLIPSITQGCAVVVYHLLNGLTLSFGNNMCEI